jgi:transcription elongation factor GreA
MGGDRIVRLTAEGKTRLEEELTSLQTQRQPDLAARIQEATEHGDVSDNGEYEDLKEEWVMVEVRIRDLEHTLEHAQLIQRDPEDDAVGLGSRVTLRSDDGDEESWIVVSPEEANTLDGTISTESPVGRALLGCRAGDSPHVTTPGGTMVYTVVKVA